ncbi:MAG: alpha/beta hydrolase-fold protein [Myxococcota bacterium]
MRRSLFGLVLLLTACGDGDGGGGGADGGADGGGVCTSENFVGCQSAFSASFDGTRVEAVGADFGDLEGFALEGPSGHALDAVDVDAACADDILPDGFVPVGKAIAITPAPRLFAREVKVTLPLRCSQFRDGAHRGHIQLFWQRDGAQEPLSPAVANLLIDLPAGRASFLTDELGIFQLGVRENAGTPRTRRHLWRAIAGISMGGVASAMIAMRHPELFDIVAPLGADPGADLTYMAGYFQDFFLGGFCTAEDEAAGNGSIGELCPVPRAPLVRQLERPSSYEAQIYEGGTGTGLTLRRNLYTKALRDVSRAFGNPAYSNPESLYLPPGVPESYLEKTAAEQCAEPVVLRGFHDREYNPDGAWPVITFCDGVDSSELGLGVFDPSLEPTSPAQVLLAVDVNESGRRDSGEPIVLHSYEHFEDVGADGLASAFEPGYDANDNPDPSADDYHYSKNPLGAEGNWQYDDGEPWDDFGVDGVEGTCQLGDGDGDDCYDDGEGNAQFDYALGTLRWFDHDPRHRLFAMDPRALADMDILLDAGIRDFLNAHVATNQLAGVLQSLTGGLRVYDQFYTLDGSEDDFHYGSTEDVDFATLGKHIYVRYGDPDASDSRINQGDGRHVGTVSQVINRVFTLFGFIDARWPGGDRDDAPLNTGVESFRENESFVSPSTGQERPYGLFLPPGYFEPENAARTYPVVYFLHGYGMSPGDLVDLSVLPANFMVNPDPAKRYQKFIVVYVDGRCRPGFELPQDPAPEDGDGCEQGTFYLDSVVAGSAQMETLLIELIDHIDANFRTKQPEEIEVVD